MDGTADYQLEVKKDGTFTIHDAGTKVGSGAPEAIMWSGSWTGDEDGSVRLSIGLTLYVNDERRGGAGAAIVLRAGAGGVLRVTSVVEPSTSEGQDYLLANIEGHVFRKRAPG